MDQPKKNIWMKLKNFYRECIRVLRVTKKPNMMEFKTIVQVSGLGIVIIGGIGFVITIVQILIKLGFA